MPRPTKPKPADKAPDADTIVLPDLFASDPVNWGSVDPTVLRSCIDAATRTGHAVMLSLSSDGGTLVLTFLIGNARPKKYFHNGAEAEAFLRSYTEWLLDEVLHS